MRTFRPTFARRRRSSPMRRAPRQGGLDSGHTRGAPTPACDSKPRSGYGCFVPAPPEPGTDIPQQSLTFSIARGGRQRLLHRNDEERLVQGCGAHLEPQALWLQGNRRERDSARPEEQNNIGAMFGGSVIQTLRTNKKLKMIMFTDDFLGHFIWADPKLGLKPVADYMKQGLPFQEALRKRWEPLVARGRRSPPRPRSTPGLDQYGVRARRMKVPPLLLVDDPEILVLSRSGKSPFSVPLRSPPDLRQEAGHRSSASATCRQCKGRTDVAGRERRVHRRREANRTSSTRTERDVAVRLGRVPHIDGILATRQKGGLLAALSVHHSYNGTNLDERAPSVIRC